MWQWQLEGSEPGKSSALIDGYQEVSLYAESLDESSERPAPVFYWDARLRTADADLKIGRLRADVSYALNAVTLRDIRGRTLFLAEMPHRHDRGQRLDWRYMNLRPSRWLAKRLGQPWMAEQVIGAAELQGPLDRFAAEAATKGNANCRGGLVWPAAQAPADVQLLDMPGVQAMRCDGCSVDSTQGRVVIAPDATLVNVGQSDIPWYHKFFGAPQPPYNNDQHPYLVWAMYRIDADGSLHPLGSSGVKHAFYAQNDMCTCAGDNILYRGCSDLYSRSTNDANSLLGPRDEIAPRSGLWGRCGSVFDPDCNGVENFSGYAVDLYDRRLVVEESRMLASLHPGASYWIEAWYLVREDSNLDNSMARQMLVPGKLGSGWTVSLSGSLSNGPVVSQWVDPADTDPRSANQLIDRPNGRLRLAVRVSDLGNGEYRYRYALMNLDYADAQFSGSEPGLLRLLSQSGARRLTWPLHPDDGNRLLWRDETGENGGGWRLTPGSQLQLEATSSLGLGWGRMLVVEFSSRFAPQPGSVELALGSSENVNVSTLVPVVVDRIIRDGFE